jgi:tripartite ATP-independent transporter DctP family solute receptor
MRNRRQLVLCLVLFSAVCSAALATLIEPADAGAQPQTGTYVMKIATIAPEGTPWEKQLRKLKRYLEEGSGGRLKVKMFMGGSLGGEKALVRRTSQGSVQCFGGSTAALGSLVQELNVIEAPYVFDTAEQADAALDGPAKAQIAGMLTKRGFVFGLWAENGFRSWFTKERPIRTPADLRGLRMRSQEAPVHLETYRAFGASPVPIDATNVLTSLQTGVVDGFDNTMIFAYATSWYQGARHLNLSRHSYQPGIVAFSKTWFDSLPADLQTLINNIPPEMVAEGRRSVRAMDPVLQRNLTQYGIQVHEPTPAERAAFVQASRAVADRVAKKSGAGGAALLRALRQR